MNYLYNLIKNKFPNQTIFPLNIYDYLNNYESSDIFEEFCALERSEKLDKEIVVWSQFSPNKKESLGLCEIDIGIDLISNNDNSSPEIEQSDSTLSCFTYIGQCKNYCKKGYICARHIERTLFCAHHSRFYLKNFDIFKTIEFITPLDVTLGRTKINHQGEFNHILLDKVELSNKWMTKLNSLKIKEEDVLEKREFINDLQLRECQQKVLDYIKANPSKKILKISLPCGSGKTLIAIKWLCDVEKWLILVPSILLAEQIYDYLIDNKIFTKEQIGLCYDGKYIIKNKVICVYNSFFKIKDRKFNKIFVDESHHILNKGINGRITNKEKESYLDEIKNNLLDETKNRKILFMSATMRKPDFKYSLREAIEDKILVDYYVHIPIYTGNWEVSLIEYFKNRLYLYSILAFCNNIENAKKFSEMCVKEGLTSDWISGEMNKKKRKEILNKFEKGETRILVSVKVLGEGINIPYANTCAFVQPKHSYYQIIQNCGRVFRTSKGKESAHIILPGICEDDFENGEDINENNCQMYDFIRALGDDDYILKESISKNSQRIIIDKVEPKVDDKEDEEDEENDKGQIIREIIIEGIKEKQKPFDEKINLIKEYIVEFNKFPVAKTKYKDVNIGIFLAYNRILFRNKKLSQDRIDKFNSIDFNLLNEIKKVNLTFEEKTKLIKEYMKENPDKYIIHSTIYKDIKIGEFTKRFKDSLRKKELTQDKIDILNEIDPKILELSPPKVIFPFEESIKLVKEYIEINEKLPKNKTEYKGRKIGRFLEYYRLQYDEGKLSQDKIDIFNNIDKKILKPENNYVAPRPFEFYISLLKEYIEINKKIPIQTTVYKNINIGDFVSKQRKKCNNKKLEQEKINILNDIDIKILDYKKPKQQFEFYIPYIIEYIKINKKIPYRKTIFKDVNIGDFISRQKTKYKNNELEQEKIDILNNIDKNLLL